MDNKQHEITLEDVRKMTDEQRAKITPEQKARLMEEKQRWERINCLDFINNQNFKEFLDSNGYEIVGYDHNRYDFDKRYIYFSSFDGYEKAYRSTNRNVILLGPQSKWEEYYVDDFTCPNIVNNPFVKYISWSLTEFKIYSIVNNPGADGWGSDESSYCARLEKDLSNEWIKFWALKEEDYAKYVLKECKAVQNETPKNIEYYDNLLAQRIAELQAEHTERIDGANKKLEKYTNIEKLVKDLKPDFQV